MEPSSHEPGWMSLLDESRIEERVSHLRIAVVLLISGAAIWALIADRLDTTQTLIIFTCLGIGLAAPLITLSISRSQTTSTALVFINNGVDVSVLTGVSLVNLQAGDVVLGTMAQFGYLLFLAASGLRIHLTSSVFAAGLAVLQVGGIVIWITLMKHPPAFGSMLTYGLLALILVVSGIFLLALILGIRRGMASNDEVERIHKRVLNQVSDGLLVCNSLGTVIEINAAATEVLGLPRAYLFDREVFTVLPAPLAKELELQWSEILAEGIVLVEGVEFERDGEETCFLDVAAHRIRYRGEDIVQIVLRDTTVERKLLEIRLQAERLDALRSMSGSIAHEFNNMFASIEASSYVLAEAIPKSAPESVEVDIIRGAAARAAGLVRELRDLTDVRKPQGVPLDVVDMIDRALADNPGNDSVKVVMDVAQDVKRLLGDEGQISRALSNLIGCAHAAMLDGGTLTIRASNAILDDPKGDLAAGGYIAICIQDTGIGLPADLVVHAFDPIAANQGGRWTGFALANVQAVATRHGGSVELASSLGRGTVFTLTLPATDSPAVRGVSTVPPHYFPGKKTRLLVVDDEAANRNSLARLLSRRGYEVVLAEDGSQAMAECEKCDGQFDLILLDLVMPGLNGRDVMQALRARYPDIRVLLVTGFADQKLLQEALDAGALSFATKPFVVPQLLGQIQEMTETSEHKNSDRPSATN